MELGLNGTKSKYITYIPIEDYTETMNRASKRRQSVEKEFWTPDFIPASFASSILHKSATCALVLPNNSLRHLYFAVAFANLSCKCFSLDLQREKSAFRFVIGVFRCATFVNSFLCVDIVPRVKRNSAVVFAILLTVAKAFSNRSVSHLLESKMCSRKPEKSFSTS